jgi:hypothetical protein
MIVVILICLIFIFAFFYFKREKFTDNISIIKNNNILSIYFENLKNNDNCIIRLFEKKDKKEKPLREITLELDKDTIFNKHDIILEDLGRLDPKSKLKAELELGDIKKSVSFEVEEEIRKYTEDVMCHADGSISYGFCDEEDSVPGFSGFFTPEKYQERLDLMHKLKKYKTHKIVIK